MLRSIIATYSSIPIPTRRSRHGERQRLFELPRSSWADYDGRLISTGGGVHSRQLKSIALTPEVRNVLGIDGSVTELRPDDLISAILRAPVDLLWNGGIGTYVKASTESDADVGDRANDSLRVDGSELRACIVGEGGNLGLTQLARVEYALNGGLIYTDAIDNSAGVDCSDHEVNIKILLDQLVRDGELTVKQRNELLVEMTDEVSRLVLDDNRAQTLALMIARTQSLAMVNVHARYLDTLEAEGYLDRDLEFLPSDKQIAERQSAGSGLRAPEFAVMIAYTKNANVVEVLDSDLPDEPALESDLMDYFPVEIRERFPDAIRSHRLRREIIATTIVNDMVNLAGISFDHRMTEDSGASVSDVTRAFLAAREIFGFADLWREIDAARKCDRPRHPDRAVHHGSAHDRAWRGLAVASSTSAARHRRRRGLVLCGAGISRRIARRRRQRQGGRGCDPTARRTGRRWCSGGPCCSIGEVAVAPHRVRHRRDRPHRGAQCGRCGHRVLGHVRCLRSRVVVGWRQQPAAIGPLAGAGSLGVARRPPDGAGGSHSPGDAVC